MSRPKRKRPLELLGGEPIDAFGRINVLRHEEDGTRLLGIVASDDLNDSDAFRARFGGGAYTLVARTPDNRRIAARIPLALEGAPKPIADAPLAKPTGRRAGATDAKREPTLAHPHGTGAGALEATVFRMLRTGATLEQVVDTTHVPSRIVRALYLEWLTDLGDELPKTREEIAERAKIRREQRMVVWDRASAERATSEGSNSGARASIPTDECASPKKPNLAASSPTS